MYAGGSQSSFYDHHSLSFGGAGPPPLPGEHHPLVNCKAMAVAGERGAAICAVAE